MSLVRAQLGEPQQSSLLTTLFSFLSKYTAKSGEKVSVKKRLNFNSWGNSENRIIITSDSELSCRLFCCRINMFMNIRLTINLKISPRAWCQTFLIIFYYIDIFNHTIDNNTYICYDNHITNFK